MKGVIDRVGQVLNQRCCSKSTKLVKEGCRVDLDGVTCEKMIVDCDHKDAPFSNNSHKCDYLVVAENGRNNYLVPLELKKGGIPSVGHVVKQLQAGAKFFQTHVPSNIKVDFSPILASGRLTKYEKILFRKPKNTIKFHQKRFVIERIRCGAKLTQVVSFIN